MIYMLNIDLVYFKVTKDELILENCLTLFFLLYNKILSLPPVNIEVQLWTVKHIIFYTEDKFEIDKGPLGDPFPALPQAGDPSF